MDLPKAGDPTAGIESPEAEDSIEQNEQNEGGDVGRETTDSGWEEPVRKAEWTMPGGELIAKSDMDEIFPVETNRHDMAPRSAYARRISELIRSGALDVTPEDEVLEELSRLAQSGNVASGEANLDSPPGGV